MKNSNFQRTYTGSGLTLFLITLYLLSAFGASAQEYLWANRMGSTTEDKGQAITVDDDGNVYTTGFFEGTVDFDPGVGTTNLTSVGNSSDIFVSKLDASGNLIWVKSMGGSGTEYGTSIVVDDWGNIYIGGFFTSTVDFDSGVGVTNLTSAGNNDIFICKMNASGDFMWAKSMGDSESDAISSMAVDDQGNVYAVGSFQGTIDFDPDPDQTATLVSAGSRDAFILKLDDFGNYIWAKRMGGTDFDQGISLASDEQGNIYIAGSFESTADFDPSAGTAELTSAGLFDIYILKLDAAGDYVWVKRMGGTDSDFVKSIAVDNDGNVYTTGFFYETADFDPGSGTAEFTSVGSQDVFVSKLDGSGDFVWAKQMGGTNLDYGQYLTIDRQNNVYITGYFINTVDFDPGVGTAEFTSVGGSRDIFISKLDVAGNYISAKSIGGLKNEIPTFITIDNQNSVYITGSFIETVDFDPDAGIAELTSAGSEDIFIAKYCQIPTKPELKVTQPTCDVATGTITVTAQYEGETYSFDNGTTFQTENSQSGLETGNYEVIIKNACGYSSIDIQVTVEEQPATPDKPEITSNNSNPEFHVLTSSNASGNQWYFYGEPINGAINTDLTISLAGQYSVQTTLGVCTGESSEVLSIKNQTLDFDPIEDQILEAGTFTLEGTASSELDVSYEIISGSATVEDDVVTFTGLGTVTVSAFQAGNDHFFGVADAIEQSFEIVTITEVEKELATTINFYPNPAHNYITIQSKDRLVQVEVLEMSGKRVIVEHHRQLDVSQLRVGNYLLRVTTPSEVHVHQFIKQ